MKARAPTKASPFQERFKFVNDSLVCEKKEVECHTCCIVVALFDGKHHINNAKVMVNDEFSV